MPKILRRTQFGNPVLRAQTESLTIRAIKSPKIRQLIKNMRWTLKQKKYGIGLAANQVGESISLAIIEIQPTKLRKKIKKSERLSLVLINPRIIETKGKRTQMWEGCISFAEIFAKVPRYKQIRLAYLDENGRKHKRLFKDLPAHVIQHEVDHLKGTLFVDRVKDSKSYITLAEYKKLLREKSRVKPKSR